MFKEATRIDDESDSRLDNGPQVEETLHGKESRQNEERSQSEDSLAAEEPRPDEDPRQNEEEELRINLDKYLEQEDETEEQKTFNELSMDDKLNRLNQLVQQSQVYSQIILDNMLEKSLQKKRTQEKIDRGEIVVTQEIPNFDSSELLGESDLEEESEEEEEVIEEPEIEEIESDDSESELQTPKKNLKGKKQKLKVQTSKRSLQSQASKSRTGKKPEVIEIELASDDDLAPSSRTRSARSGKRQALGYNEPRKKAKTSTKKTPKETKKGKAKNIKEPKTKKLKKPKNKASKETKKMKQAIEAAQTGHKQLQPVLISGCTMKDYQLDGLEWLVTLYENGLNGILADEMGLGKTLQCIALMSYLIEHGVKGPFLVVAPLSTVSNWCREFERFAPKVKVLQYTGDKTKRHRYSFGKTLRAQVVVTSYEVVIKDHRKFQITKWSYLTVDEGHRLKNFDCILVKFLKKLNVGNRLILTGTPLQNNLKELWSLLNFILPDIFHDLDLFQLWFDFDDFGASVSEIDEEEKRLLKMKVQELFIKNLHSILKPFLLRRMKKDVMKDLPPKKEYILYSQLTPLQSVFYGAIMDDKLLETVLQAYLKEYLLLNHNDLFKDINDLKRVDSILHKLSREPYGGPKRYRQTRFDTADIQRIEEANDSDLMVSDYEDVNPEQKRASQRLEPRNPESKLESIHEAQVGLAALDDLVSQYQEDSEKTLQSAKVKLEFTHPNSVFFETPAGSRRQETKNIAMGSPSKDELTPPSDDGRGDPMSKQNSSAPTTVQSTPVPDVKEDENAAQEALPENESDDEFFSMNGEDDVIEVLSEEDEEPEDEQFTIVKQLRNEFGPYVRRLALRNLVMQMRKVCGSHYCYYTPFPQKMHFEPKLAKLLMENSGKLQMLKQLLKRLTKDGHKVLVFSQFTTVLDFISLCLEQEGIICSQLDGRSKQEDREEEINDFSADGDDSSQVFLLSTRAGGLGLNLVKADTVILFDNDWNPQMDLQAIDRVHRIGQTKPVKIFRFVVRDTVEELLIIKSFNKRLLEKMVIQLGNFQLGRVAKQLADENIDLASVTSIKNLLDLGQRLNLHGSGSEKLSMDKFNEILVQLHEVREPLTSEEMDELMDRSSECYTREVLSFANVTSFETTNNMDSK